MLHIAAAECLFVFLHTEEILILYLKKQTNDQLLIRDQYLKILLKNEKSQTIHM